MAVSIRHGMKRMDGLAELKRRRVKERVCERKREERERERREEQEEERKSPMSQTGRQHRQALSGICIRANNITTSTEYGDSSSFHSDRVF